MTYAHIARVTKKPSEHTRIMVMVYVEVFLFRFGPAYTANLRQ